MSTETYSIPPATSPTACFDFQRNAYELAFANAAAWGIPPEVFPPIAEKRSIYEQKYAITANPSSASQGATANRNAAWADELPLIVGLYNDYIINNAAISEADKKAMYVHAQSGHSTTPYPAPTTVPIVNLVSEEISALHIMYADSSAPNTHYKPAGVAFCELVFEVGTAPASAAVCTERHYVARSHEAMMFTADQRGKTIYAFARWVNKNGKYGPWSAMFQALIP